jgi:hypothetical protein
MNTTESDKPKMVPLAWCIEKVQEKVKEQKEVSEKKCEEYWIKEVNKCNEDCDVKIDEIIKAHTKDKQNTIKMIGQFETDLEELTKQMNSTTEEDRLKYLELQENLKEEQKKVKECSDKFIQVISDDWDKLNQCEKSIRWLAAYGLIGEGDNRNDIRKDARRKFRKFARNIHPDKGNLINSLVFTQVTESFRLVYENDNRKCYNELHDGEEESVIPPSADPITPPLLELENIETPPEVIVTPPLEQENIDTPEPTNSKNGYVIWMLILCVVGLGSFLGYLLLNRKYINTSKSLFQTIETVKYINRLKFYRELSLIVFIITFVLCFIVLMFYIFSLR